VVAGREELKSTDRGGARRGRTYIAEVVDASGTRVVWKKGCEAMERERRVSCQL
jgi:hypothetical protein